MNSVNFKLKNKSTLFQCVSFKSVLPSVIILMSLFSCAKLKENREIKKYDGYWKLVKIEIQNYDTLGKVSNVESFDTTGLLKLSKDGVYKTEGINNFKFSGNWALSYYGKRDVLMIDETRATVSKKSKSNLEFEFATGDGQGRLKIIKKYYFEYEKKIDYKEEEELQNGIKFKDGNGKDHYFLSNGIITTVETNWNQTKYKSIIDFINTKDSNGDYKFLRITLIGDENGFANSSYTWNGAWATNALYSIQFWDDGTNSSGIINASLSTDFVVSANDLKNQLSIKGTIQSVDFASNIPSIGSNKFTNLVIDVIP